MGKNILIPWWKTNLGVKEAKMASSAIIMKNISQGKLTERLEKSFSDILNVPYVLLTTNGSTALLASLVAFGVKPDDEVIIPGLTFIATAQAPTLLGVVIKSADVCKMRPLVNLKEIDRLIGRRTKAIIPVHLNGRGADVAGINKLAQQHNFKVIEDSAQSLCSKNMYGYLGTQADIGVFSLGITKLITTVRGGLIVTKDKRIYNELKRIRDGKCVIGDENLSRTYALGFNFKFNDILAAIGLSQIERIGRKITQHKNIYAFYKEKLRGMGYIQILENDIPKGELPLWIEALSVERDKVISLLKSKKVEAKPFDRPINDFKTLGIKSELKFSRIYADHGLILPSGTGQNKEDLEYVIKCLKEIRKEINFSPQEYEQMKEMGAYDS